MRHVMHALVFVFLLSMIASGQDWWKPYSPSCTERENVFEFTEKPKVRKVAEDRYEITFSS